MTPALLWKLKEEIVDEKVISDAASYGRSASKRWDATTYYPGDISLFYEAGYLAGYLAATKGESVIYTDDER